MLGGGGALSGLSILRLQIWGFEPNRLKPALGLTGTQQAYTSLLPAQEPVL